MILKGRTDKDWKKIYLAILLLPKRGKYCPIVICFEFFVTNVQFVTLSVSGSLENTLKHPGGDVLKTSWPDAWTPSAGSSQHGAQRLYSEPLLDVQWLTGSNSNVALAPTIQRSNGLKQKAIFLIPMRADPCLLFGLSLTGPHRKQPNQQVFAYGTLPQAWLQGIPFGQGAQVLVSHQNCALCVPSPRTYLPWVTLHGAKSPRQHGS